MDLRQLRILLAIAGELSFTDAAIRLGLSQAAVSRGLAALEAELGVQLVHRTTRAVQLTPAGERTVANARLVLASVDDLVREARGDGGVLRLGYAWSALGRHTIEVQRRFEAANPATALELHRTNTPTAGLAEGTSDLAILRRPVDTAAVDLVLVGLERRYCAMSSDDPLARRRSVTLADLASHTVAIDDRTGSTGIDLWPEGARPTVVATHEIEDWLTIIATGRAVGVTAEATVQQHGRTGIVYRLVRDAPPLPVYLAWSRARVPAARSAVLDLLIELYRGNSVAS